MALMTPEYVKTTRQNQRLRKVGDVRRRELAVAVELREAVAAARASGASWTDLGKALGTSRQSATERFS